jgi:hypothetical protein
LGCTLPPLMSIIASRPKTLLQSEERIAGDAQQVSYLLPASPACEPPLLAPDWGSPSWLSGACM